MLTDPRFLKRLGGLGTLLRAQAERDAVRDRMAAGAARDERLTNHLRRDRLRAAARDARLSLHGGTQPELVLARLLNVIDREDPDE